MREHLKRARSGGAEVGLERAVGTSSHICAGRPQARSHAGCLLPEFQEGAVAGSASGSTDALVREVVRVGHRGRHRGNCHRYVVSKLSKRCDKPPLYSTQIPLWDADTNAPCRRATFNCLMRSLAGCCPRRPTCLTTSKCPMEADSVHSRLGNQLRAGGPSRGCVRSLG